MNTKQWFRISVAGLLLAGISMAGQDWNRGRDWRSSGERRRPRVFAGVREDVERICSARFASYKEQRRLQRTQEELAYLQSTTDQGGWDNGTVNDVIDSLRKSANDDRLSPRERAILGEDAERIHDLQARRNGWAR